MLWMGLAMAGTPLLYDGGQPNAVAAAVAQRTGLPPDQLGPISLTELRNLPPAAKGDAVIRRCTGAPSTNSEVRAELVRAEAALTEDDIVSVIDHLDLAIAGLGCLSEVVDARAVARVFLLRGGVAAEQGREEEARGELTTALSFDPAISWPAGYPVEGSPLLGSLVAGRPMATVKVLPKPTSGPWIDGQEAGEAAELAAGLHLAQHSARTGLATSWLVVGGDASWVLLEALAPSALDRFVAGERELVVEAVLAAHPEQAAAYVSHQGGLWLVVRGGEVQELQAPAVGPDSEETGRKGKKGKKGR